MRLPFGIRLVIPLLMLMFGLGFLFWNEATTARQDATVASALARITPVDSENPAAGHDGRLVYVTGEAAVDGMVTDPLFDVSVKALRLDRNVLMLQWREVERGSNKDRRYEYDLVWSDRPIDSRLFHRPANHVNPAQWPFTGERFYGRDIRVGKLDVANEVIANLPGEPLTVPAPVEPIAGLKLRPVDDELVVADPDSPQLGDIRVSFTVAPPEIVSIGAQLDGDRLVPHRTRDQTTLALIARGEVPPAAMFAAVDAKIAEMNWVYRGIGTGIVLFGVIATIITLPREAPALSRILAPVGPKRMVIAVPALAFALALVAIGTGWILFRPLIALACLTSAAVLFVCYRLARNW